MARQLLIIVVLVLSGCGQPPGDVTISATGDGPDLLVSEVQAAPDRTALVGCYVIIHNADSVERRVKLSSTGCSCYGFVEDDIPVDVGDVLTVPPKKGRTLRFHAVPADSDKEEQLSAVFAIIERDGTQRSVPVTSKVRTYADLSAVPRALTVEVKRGASKDEVKEAQVDFIYRKHDDYTLEASQWPAWVKLQEAKISQVTVPFGHNVYQNLRQITWTIHVEVEVTADTPRRADPLHLPLVVKDSTGKTAATIDLLLSLYEPVSVAFPSRVDFGSVPVAEGKSRRILIASTDGNAFSLSMPLDSKPDWLDVKSENGAAVEHWIEMIASPKKSGAFEGQLKFNTSRADLPEIVLEIAGTGLTD